VSHLDSLSQTPPETWRHSCSLAAEPRSASRARAFVCQCLVEYRLLHLVDSVRLVASELVTNAVVHAQTPSVLTLSRSGSALDLGLTDGSGQRPRRRPASSEQSLETGGYGLGILDALSLEWGVITDFNSTKTIWARFDAHPRERAVSRAGTSREGSLRTS
jgi:anti-sigma regulatory factor (Ser/Thr protein kinase)